MIKLFVLRCAIPVWKGAIAVSLRFKPSTWQTIAVSQAVLAAVLFYAYGRQQCFYPEIPRALLVQSNQPRSQIDANPRFTEVLLNRHSFNCERMGEACRGVLPRWSTTELKVTLRSSEPDNQISYLPGEQAALNGEMSRSRIEAGFSSSLSSPGSGESQNGFKLRGPLNFGFHSVLAIQVPNRSFLDKVQQVLVLTQALALTMGSVFASLFGWIAYYRGKAELKLKKLQIMELEARLEQMKRERQRELEEASKSCIIIAT